MSFNSIVFILYFLPLALLLYHVSAKSFKNTIMLVISLIFYAWGSPYTLYIVGITIVINYFFGLLIAAHKKHSNSLLTISIILNVGILTYYKYTNFFINLFNRTIGKIAHVNLSEIKIIAPIGLSYIAFQCISYLVDVYKKDEKPVKNFIDFAMYITLFPKLIAGPILKFKDFAYQLNNRVHSVDKFSDGAYRFSLGLGKKVLIAGALETVANNFFITAPNNLGIGFAWLGMIVYTLQIYYDFSGYTDMAIGLGEMFGFNLPENFNKPYTATSITDFWKRWHISLTSFLRDYIYIPLGGNRKGSFRAYLNTFIVFFVSGFWHGASYTFIIWGMYHGILSIIEKAFLLKILKKLPRFVCKIYAFVAVSVGWVFFNASSGRYALSYIKALIVPRVPQYNLEAYAIDNKFIFIFVLALVMAIIPRIKVAKLISNNNIMLSSKAIFSLMILILSVAYLTTGSFAPFIYLQF